MKLKNKETKRLQSLDPTVLGDELIKRNAKVYIPKSYRYSTERSALHAELPEHYDYQITPSPIDFWRHE